MFNDLLEANITDLEVRRKHIELLKNKSSIDVGEYDNPASTCKTCGKAVSEKVRTYCLSNSERFKSNIYCYDHQK